MKNLSDIDENIVFFFNFLTKNVCKLVVIYVNTLDYLVQNAR